MNLNTTAPLFLFAHNSSSHMTTSGQHSSFCFLTGSLAGIYCIVLYCIIFSVFH